MTDLALLAATVRGRVQGVFFRAFVRDHARELDLSGYVRNLNDGSVEIRVEGERQRLEKLVDYLHSGPPGSNVKEVDVSWSEYTGRYTGFNVEY